MLLTRKTFPHFFAKLNIEHQKAPNQIDLGLSRFISLSRQLF
ncbi:hypothetical protein HMPREF1128_0974 [Haemophilus sputorum HK 2154]|nr:hypothetical protein HMPREF1128_0974 [Haemophilus sputorum HK 2154]